MNGTIYEGFFLNGHPSTLDDRIDNMHIRYSFRPDCDASELYGRYVVVRVIGYDTDGKDKCYIVKFIASNSLKIKEIFDSIETPYITPTIADDTKPINSRALNFVELPEEEQFVLGATFGAFIDNDGTEEYVFS